MSGRKLVTVSLRAWDQEPYRMGRARLPLTPSIGNEVEERAVYILPLPSKQGDIIRKRSLC